MTKTFDNEMAHSKQKLYYIEIKIFINAIKDFLGMLVERFNTDVMPFFLQKSICFK